VWVDRIPLMHCWRVDGWNRRVEVYSFLNALSSGIGGWKTPDAFSQDSGECGLLKMHCRT
jgi:hypothetical protein